ncbi:MAG TPA: hypothetical protein VMZ71_09180 [Gemmataceae bacterium]|nr:hypothetical protein [Gemmataceae bacterium]
MKPRRRKDFPPPRGTTESFEMVDAGEPTYFVQVPPAKSVVAAVPGDRVEVADADEPVALDPARPLVPDADELAKLPAAARAAYLVRCGQRVAPLRNGDASPTDPQTAANLILTAALVCTPVRRQLRAVRKDYDRLKWFVRRYNLADDTPVPLDVFGPLWAEGQTPAWALPK